MIYLPLLEETGYRPTQKYTLAPEIFGHAQRIGRHFGPYEKSLFSTEVTALGWDETSSRWIVQTDRGDRIRARFVSWARARCTGPSSRVSLASRPLPGTASTPADGTTATPAATYSGAPMDKLGDKRVGIIGTGATAVQCIPQLARAARAAVRVPTHAVLDRRPQQPPHRTGILLHARGGLAGRSG